MKIGLLLISRLILFIARVHLYTKAEKERKYHIVHQMDVGSLFQLSVLCVCFQRHKGTAVKPTTFFEVIELNAGLERQILEALIRILPVACHCLPRGSAEFSMLYIYLIYRFRGSNPARILFFNFLQN